MCFCILTDGRANSVPFHRTVYKDSNTYIKLEANGKSSQSNADLIASFLGME